MSETCGRTGCTNPATERPVLILKPRFYLGKPVRAMLGLGLCDEHVKGTELADVMGDEGWQRILSGFDAAKLMHPARELTKLDFVPIGSTEERELGGVMSKAEGH